MREALDDPHVRASDYFTRVDFPGVGDAPVAATPVKLHGTPGAVVRRAPTLGEHNEEVLFELGYSKGEIDALFREKVV
jgi:formyl-CoA transferase